MKNRILITSLVAFINSPAPSYASFCIANSCFEDLSDLKKQFISLQKTIIKTHSDVLNHNEQLPVIKKDIKQNKEDIKKNNSDIKSIKDDTFKNKATNEQNKKEILNNKKGVMKNKVKIEEIHRETQNNSNSLNQLSGEIDEFRQLSNNRFQKIDKTVAKNHKKAMAGISAAMAMNAIPFVNGKDVSVGVGSGSYGGQGSLAIGSQFQMTEIMRSSTYLSYDSNRNLGIAAGISIGW
ncbi:hypothetical protein PZBJ_06060 [Pantoea endophytica]|uniref:Trimeric autotransporter adhesin YadA-like C-terminal membrane anchor domain-containing protein n=1 Tax=Pantoea endophytica TaxID=92488 RepID=A0ABX4SVB3_9GAMM|nr:YadA-like family protein [Pantoea endophytica]PLR26346.1 hypothetical protein PZBJ_06060 [Pantoea endophytica]